MVINLKPLIGVFIMPPSWLTDHVHCFQCLSEGTCGFLCLKHYSPEAPAHSDSSFHWDVTASADLICDPHRTARGSVPIHDLGIAGTRDLSTTPAVVGSQNAERGGWEHQDCCCWQGTAWLTLLPAGLQGAGDCFELPSKPRGQGDVPAAVLGTTAPQYPLLL